jgi:predicted DNA-binding transcriptional regulator YafY
VVAELVGDGDGGLEAVRAGDASRAEAELAEVGDDAVVERGDDGSVVLELAVTNRDGFRSFVLGFLDHAEVLAPDELRDDVVDWLRSLVATG